MRHSFNEGNYFLPISRLFEVFRCQIRIFEYQSKTGGVVGISVVPLLSFDENFQIKLSKTLFCE